MTLIQTNSPLCSFVTHVTVARGRFCVFPGSVIRKVAKCNNVSDFQNLDPVTRDKYLKKLRAKGISIRQLSRLTGISFSVIRKF